MDEKQYDVIVIGSGIGGLACASILAQTGKKRVLILERHSKAGGFTHVFKRETKYEWDVGLHYVGEMQKGSPIRAVSDFITAGKVIWNPLPDPYDIFVYPDFKFKARRGAVNLKKDLIAQFPQEKQTIEKYFQDLKAANNWLSRYMMARSLPGWMHFISALLLLKGATLARLTTAEYLRQHNIQDPRLQAVLVSQWGNYGLPPCLSSFIIHAVIVNHYMHGGYYPSGGAKTISDSIVPVIEQAGGRVLPNHQVTEILIEHGQAVGVRAVKRKSEDSTVHEFHAHQVVSDAGARLTYGKLLPDWYHHSYIEQLKQYPTSAGHVNLYIGFKMDPRQIWPIQGENYWLFSGYDHDEMYRQRNELLSGTVQMAYLSFPSLKKSESPWHTAEIISFVDYKPFEKWADQPIKKRDKEYLQLKEKISQALLDFVEARFHGFKEQVAYYELSTPLTTEYYTDNPQGNIYGIPATPDRYKQKWIGLRTPLKNLYLTGSDAASHGVAGAMMAGVFTAAAILGLPGSLFRIFRNAYKFSNNLLQ